jgi:hypothetical protein
MISPVPWLAVAQDVDELLEQARLPKSTLIQTSIVVGSLLVVTGLIAGWVIFFRKKRRHRHEHHWKNRDAQSAAAAGNSGTASSAENRKDRRRRRPRNPTLAETRGLPPVRDRQSNRPPPY